MDNHFYDACAFKLLEKFHTEFVYYHPDYDRAHKHSDLIIQAFVGALALGAGIVFGILFTIGTGHDCLLALANCEL